MNLDIISFNATAPGTGAAMAAVAGDPNTVRNAAPGSRVMMLGLWTWAQGVGYTQLTWPSGHDLVRGFRARNLANQITNKVPAGGLTSFRGQDPLTITEVGSASSGKVETAMMLFWYEDLPGIDAHLIDMPTLIARGRNILTIEDTITTTGGGVGYSGARALNAASDLLKANTEYAILGAQVGANCGGLTVRGVDFGGLRIGMPGDASIDPTSAAGFFCGISEQFDLPAIPVFNSANRAGTFIEALGNDANTAVPFSLFLCELDQVQQENMDVPGGTEQAPVVRGASNLGRYLHPAKA